MAKFRFQAIIFGFLVAVAQCQGGSPNNVLDYGAIGDGHVDDTVSFQNAWEATCRSKSNSTTMYVPAGLTFLLQPVVFSGPCLSDGVNMVIDGTLSAPGNPFEWSRCDGGDCDHWISFKKVNGLNIYGSGTINPNGKKWWTTYCDGHSGRDCPARPAAAFVVANSKKVRIDGLHFRDSPNVHLVVDGSNHVHISNLGIVAPRTSPNTDGIHVQHSEDVTIEQCQIGTGDDCISIDNDSSNLNIHGIRCGPGHGISIGSLGKHGRYGSVQNVHISDVVFRRSDNGVRIKTWPGGRGFVKNVTFERITSENARYPIVIDQNYCIRENCPDQTSAVQISDISYNNIKGTSSSRPAIKLLCSEAFPCRNINMTDIDIRGNRSGRKATAYCSNVIGTTRGANNPKVSCLKQA